MTTWLPCCSHEHKHYYIAVIMSHPILFAEGNKKEKRERKLTCLVQVVGRKERTVVRAGDLGGRKEVGKRVCVIATKTKTDNESKADNDPAGATLCHQRPYTEPLIKPSL